MRFVLGVTATMLLFLSAPTSLASQEQVVSGVVVDDQGIPVPSIQVTVDGADLGVLTNSAGSFRLAGVPAGTFTLRVSGIGIRTELIETQGGTMDLRIAVTRTAISLDEIVVTGTPGGARRRSLGNALGSIEASALIESAPVSSTGELLNARVPGVVVRTGEGYAGGGSRILIRGRGSMQFGGNPLLYIDGVRVNNDVPTGGIGSSLSRFNDIDPADIESIEIIKGPAASTLYGTEASAGVIQIITKKGRAGSARFAMSVRQGASWLGDPHDKVGLVWGTDPVSGQSFSLDMLDVAEERGSPMFRTGHLQGYGLSVSGGSDNIQYFVSANYDADEGIIPSNVAERFTGRATLSFQPRETVTMNAQIGVTTGETYLDPGFYFGRARYALPFLRDTPGQGFLINPPDVALATEETWQDVQRYMGSLTVDHRPSEWLNHQLTVGLDLTHLDNTSLTPFVPNEFAEFFPPTSRLGSKTIQGVDTEYTTFTYNANGTLGITDRIGSTTSAGAQYYRRLVGTENLSGQEFPAPGVTSLAGITGQRQVSEDLVENTTLGLYVQQQFSWDDRLFLTGAIRADDNSAFGADFDIVTYPKLSASWVISEEGFWNLGLVNALKLRAAYGESGQQPDNFAALRTYEPVSGEYDQPGGSPNFVGNPELGPERGQEIEVGFEAGLLDDRIGLDFTYYNQKTTDAIVSREVAPSSGFPLTQFVNVGEVQNTGFEVLLDARPIQTDIFGWDFTVNLSKNDNEILSLNIPGVPFLSAGNFQNRHQPGYPVAAFFGKRIVRAELDANGNATNLACDDGSGGTTSCLTAPFVYFGNQAPDVEGAVSTTFTFFEDLRLSALVDFKRGGRYFSADRAIRCRDFRIHEVVVNPTNFDPIDVAYCQDPEGTGPFAEGFIMDASFAKLREVSLNYGLPDRVTGLLGAGRASITLAARNVLTFAHDTSPFKSPDPETFNFQFESGVMDQAALPIPIQFLTTLNISF
ncbi:MAG: TonB-dependent receptor [Gemmatimonadetes bacterium]|nr:TonB-dependent receptor [Gemmatimonadota bacterium]MYG21611.1 TonB-dependent receptor [Gemmatimonadota bacterium]MYJ37847.1 TonB-dependent receptor [Gemmatimonadota bacterium]